MNTTHHKKLNREYQSHLRRRAQASGLAPNSAAPAVSSSGRVLTAGARVLDLMTGTQGKVTRDTIEHQCTADGSTKRVHTFFVTLADGSAVARSKKQLAVLPPCLVGELCFHSPLES